jgi:hypothetical protein
MVLAVAAIKGEQVHRHAIPATARDLEIVPGVLGPRAELLGTLALVLTGTARYDPVGIRGR